MSQSPVCTIDYIDHVGIAVHSLEKTLAFFQEVFGAPAAEAVDLPDQGVKACLISVGQTRLELLEPLSADTPVGRFLERRGQGLHHLALHVGDIRKGLETLEARGLELLDREPRHGLSGTIAFIHPRSVYGILTELVETP